MGYSLAIRTDNDVRTPMETDTHWNDSPRTGRQLLDS